MTGSARDIDAAQAAPAAPPERGNALVSVLARTGAAAEQFKVEGGVSDAWHAGDRVKFSVTETGGSKTITKLEKP